MRTIAVMTMLFLPATFFAALFAMPMLNWQDTSVIQPRFWIYWAFCLPCTALVLISWYFITKRQKAREEREDVEEREKFVQRTNTMTSALDVKTPIKHTIQEKTKALKRRLPFHREDIQLNLAPEME
jgi:hypothetical protein